MCGVAGLFDIKGSRDYDRETIQRMITAIAHRGPDGAGIEIQPGVALGHRRLAIIDIAGGAQPMSTREGDLTVVFNGEIYNFQELRSALEAKGSRFETHSDTEVLLHGWRAWGEGLFAKLQGQFAFALWDRPAQTLILARDHFGKKPMHYQIEQGTLSFASEIKALLTLPGADRALDREAVEDFFTYGYVPDPKTIYRSIRKLPAGHYLRATRGQPPVVRPYWSLLEEASRQSTFATPEAIADQLDQAVGRRLISDVPLGALLSGGVDSSAVVALMAGRSARPVNTFSIAFGDPDFDETTYARAVALRYGADHDVRRVDADDVDVMARLPQVYDEPFGDVSAIPTLAVCAQARQSVTVALSGDGGDEALAGYRRYAFHAVGERVRAKVSPGIRAGLFGALADVYPQGAWLPQRLRAKSTFRELSLDSASAYVRMCSALPDEVRVSLLSSDFRASLAGYDAGDVVRARFNTDGDLDSLQRAQYADLMTYLPGDILTKVDRASMSCSLEIRSPLLDPKFVAMSFALAPALKMTHADGGKVILKRAMERYLPHDLLYRPKMGFTLPLARWLSGPLRQRLVELPDSARLTECGMIDMATVRTMVDEHLSGARDRSKPLWLIWVFDAFLAHSAQSTH